MNPPNLSGRFARTRTFVSVALLGALTASCAATPERLLAGADPSDPAVRVSSTGYRPVLGGYDSLRPVAPASWREQNNRAAPVRKQ
jgi:hypothetical protein